MSKVKQTRTDIIFDIVNYTLLIIILLLVLYPLLFVLSASVSDPNAVYQGRVWLLPKDITLEGYQRIFRSKDIWTGYRNSIMYTVIGTCINLFFTITAAYPLSRKDFYGRNVITAIYTFTMFFGGGLIPTYMLVAKWLNMKDTIWALLIPNAMGMWNVIITRTYFQTNIPGELREAAAIDGCSNMKFLLKIVLPLSAPIIAVMTLFYGVGHWNAFFNALIYLNDRGLYPLQLILREILLQSQLQAQMMGDDMLAVAEQQKISEVIKYGVIIVASLPVLMLYPLLQKYFVKGIMVGSIKG